MSTYMIKHTTTITVIECYLCGISFGFPELFEETRRDDHRNFYCPNGHSQHFPHESDAERYKRLLEAEKRRSASAAGRAERAERSAAAYKGQVTKMKKRTGAGVCPCCNRTFKQLARHMKAKHPEYVEAKS